MQTPPGAPAPPQAPGAGAGAQFFRPPGAPAPTQAQTQAAPPVPGSTFGAGPPSSAGPPSAGPPGAGAIPAPTAQAPSTFNPAMAARGPPAMGRGPPVPMAQVRARSIHLKRTDDELTDQRLGPLISLFISPPISSFISHCSLHCSPLITPPATQRATLVHQHRLGRLACRGQGPRAQHRQAIQEYRASQGYRPASLASPADLPGTPSAPRHPLSPQSQRHASIPRRSLDCRALLSAQRCRPGAHRRCWGVWSTTR